MSEAKKRYDKANTKMVCLKLNKKTDADIIQRLEGRPNKQGYIKALIREDMLWRKPIEKEVHDN